MAFAFTLGACGGVTPARYAGPYNGVANGVLVDDQQPARGFNDISKVSVVVNGNTEAAFKYLRDMQKVHRNYALGSMVPKQMELLIKASDPLVISDSIMELLRRKFAEVTLDQNGLASAASGKYDGAIVVDYRVGQCSNMEAASTGYCTANAEITLFVIDRDMVRRAAFRGAGQARTTAGPFTTPSAEDTMILHTANKRAMEALVAAWP